MSSVGRHLIADLYECNPKILVNLEGVRTILTDAAIIIHATIVDVLAHQFLGTLNGISIIAVIAESHISIRTFPELRYAAVDVFTCGNLDPTEAISYIVAQLAAERHVLVERHRGLLPELQPALALTAKVPALVSSE